MNLNFELKKFAFSFVNFLFQRISEDWLSGINSIILFGSVAQNRSAEKSDIDIFFDTTFSESRASSFKKMLLDIKDEFLITNEALLFKTKRIYNDMSFTVGNLEKWSEMKKSVSSSGIVLYGKYSGKFRKDALRQDFIFSWSSSKNRGALLNKLYGYRIGKTKYKGFIAKYGKKIGKSAALISSEHKDDFMKILEKYSAKYSVIEVFAE